MASQTVRLQEGNLNLESGEQRARKRSQFESTVPFEGQYAHRLRLGFYFKYTISFQ